MTDIVIVDYEMGNLRSVHNALMAVTDGLESCRVSISGDPSVINSADKVVFPGQGAARDCMRSIDDNALRQAIIDAAKEKPFLGICMGMQVLMSHSEENDGVDLMNVYGGEVKRFADQSSTGQRCKIPQMGWNTIRQTQAHPLWHGIDDNSYFYFVHSYYVAPTQAELMVGETDYATPYCSALAQGQVFAIQSHPEKSADNGLQLLKNFIHWNGQA